MKIKRPRGFALIYTMGISAILLLFIAVSTKILINSVQDAPRQFSKLGQAANIANTGIQEAFFWFSRQKKTVSFINPPEGKVFEFPDQAFWPDGPVNGVEGDTDNESIGLVKDILIDENLRIYGHYEVKKQVKNNDPTSRTITDPVTGVFKEVQGSLAFNDPFAVHDVTHLRSGSKPQGSGEIWSIVSTGYIYQRNEPERNEETGVFKKAYNEGKNRVLSQATVSAEIQRLSLTPPEAAVTLNNAKNLTVGSKGQLNGEKAASFIYRTKGGLISLPTMNIFGNALHQPALNLDPNSIFGVSELELKGLSDTSVSSMDDLRWDKEANNSLGSMSIIYFDGNAEFTKARPLKGGGVLFVTGNLTVKDGADSFYSGLVYVKGTVKIFGSNTISGAIIAAGDYSKVEINSGISDEGVVEYSKGIIDIVKAKLANYRLNNLSFKVISRD